MADKIRSLKVMKRFSDNPFIKELKESKSIQAKSKPIYKDKPLFDVEDEEWVKQKVIIGTEYYWKDSAKYTKIYQNSLTNGLSKMGTSGIKLFFMITNRLKMNKDYVIISFEEFSAFSGISARTSYYDAIIELEKLNVIRLSNAQNMLFINPMVMFNGKREDLLEEAEQQYIEDTYVKPSAGMTNKHI